MGRQCRGEGGQVALQIDHRIVLTRRIDRLQRLEDPIGARGVVGAREHRAPAGALDCIGDRGLGAGDDHGADRRSFGTLQHVHDHRPAGDIGERFTGQSLRGHARRNEHDRVVGRRSGCGRSAHLRPLARTALCVRIVIVEPDKAPRRSCREGSSRGRRIVGHGRLKRLISRPVGSRRSSSTHSNGRHEYLRAE